MINACKPVGEIITNRQRLNEYHKTLVYLESLYEDQTSLRHVDEMRWYSSLNLAFCKEERHMTCSLPPKDAFDYLIAVTPICIAAFVALIVFWQSRINKNKLRLELYNRRFDIYSKALEFFIFLLSYNPNNVSTESCKNLHKDFIKAFRESKFLFDDKSNVYSILKQMNDKAFLIIGFKEQGAELAKADPEEFNKMNERSLEAIQWFSEAISKLEKAMARFLNFHELTA
jgi:hypothetical protein